MMTRCVSDHVSIVFALQVAMDADGIFKCFAPVTGSIDTDLPDALKDIAESLLARGMCQCVCVRE